MMQPNRLSVSPRQRQYNGFRVRQTLVALAVVYTTACTVPADPAVCLAPPENHKVDALTARLVAVGSRDGGVRIRGFTDAAPPGATVEVQLSSLIRRVQADARGRFLMDIDAEDITTTQIEPMAVPSELEIRVAGSANSLAFRIRSDADDICVKQEAIPTGTTPNDMIVHACGDETYAFVVHSSDGSVAGFSVSGAPPPPAISFPVDERQRGANPWSIALDDEGTSAGVTLFGQNSVAWIEPCTGRIRNIAAPMQPDGTPLWIEVDPPVHLELALDIDGDGETENDVERMLPRSPQGIVFADGKWMVTFTNLLQVGANPIYGPGLIVAFGSEDGKMVPVGYQQLPCTNPQSITLDAEGAPWVSCTGALGPGPNGFTALGDGHLLRLSTSTLEVLETVSMRDFGPGTPAIDGDTIVVGSLVRPKIAILRRGETSIENADIILLDETERVESIFDVVPFGGGLVLLSEYGTDRLHVLDVDAKDLNPWPFENGIAVGPGGMAFHGLQSIALEQTDLQANQPPDAFALLAQSHELVRLQLWQVMGP